jgi:rhomboid family GlyGly-CTERM serine protease
MKRMPIVTIILCCTAYGLFLLPAPVQALFYFDFYQLRAGNTVGLITGHWMHADSGHLWWNLSAFAVLGAIIEKRSRRMLLWTIAVGSLCVDLLLLSSYAELQRYCGLSGLLNTLLGAVLFIYWQETRSLWVVATGILCLGKIALELFSRQSIYTDTSWPAFASAHLVGILGAPLALWVWHMQCTNPLTVTLQYKEQ